MGEKLVPKVILEGTRLVFKTELAFLLNEHPRMVGPRKYRYHSPIVSGEWCGFTNDPWGRGLINYEADEEPQAMETYATWVRLFELLRYYSWIVDRFHLSTQVWQRLHRHRDVDFEWLEARLDALNFRVLFCTRTPESFASARERRLRVSGNPSQYDDLTVFIREQELMRELIAKTRLPVFEVDVTDNDLPAAVERTVNWLDATGGLTLPSPTGRE